MKSCSDEEEYDARCDLCDKPTFKSDIIHTDDGYEVGDYCCYDKLSWDYNDNTGEYRVTIKD
jgi:hypothetical protein